MPEVLTTGLLYGESARWHDGRLWLAHWGTDEILAVDADGRTEVMARVEPTIPFSIDWLPDGRLLVTHGARLITPSADGRFETFADLSAIARGFNEIVVDGRGNTYVNGASWDLMAGEAPRPGVVALVRPDGTSEQVADGIDFGNGMAVTADNSTLIVAESYGHRLSGFAIAADGTLGERRVWADLGDGVPDGIGLDAEGAVWHADVPNRRCVRVREGGEVVQTVDLDRAAFSCMLGGPDGRTLFMLTAQWRGPQHMADPERTGQIVTERVDVPAAGYP